MTRDDVLRMAREAGISIHTPDLERFAALIAAAERESIADELEHGFSDDENHHIQYAAAIRARKDDE